MRGLSRWDGVRWSVKRQACQEWDAVVVPWRGRRAGVRVFVAVVVLVSIVVSIPACHAGDRGSIPRRGDMMSFLDT